jgi:predicted MFS family arabinose efflux permease
LYISFSMDFCLPIFPLAYLSLRKYSASHATLGSLLFTIAIGSVVGMPFTGWLTLRFGSRGLTVISGLLIAVLLITIPHIQELWGLRVVFFLLGLSNGAMDVSMNGQAVYVERAYDKPIMSSFHGFFSLGMALGAGTSSLFSQWNIGMGMHLMIVCAVGFICYLAMYGRLIPDPPQAASDASGPAFRLPVLAVIPIGIIAFCCMSAEGTMMDWSAIYMNTVVGSSLAFSALSLGIFGAAMTVGRFVGDYFTTLWGNKKLLIIDTLLSIGGMCLVIGVANVWATLLGYVLLGLGLATIVPIVYSAAGNLPGVAPGVGIAMATTIGYAGFFVGPPLIGYIGDHMGLRWGFVYTCVLLVIMMVLILAYFKEYRKK